MQSNSEKGNFTYLRTGALILPGAAIGVSYGMVTMWIEVASGCISDPTGFCGIFGGLLNLPATIIMAPFYHDIRDNLYSGIWELLFIIGVDGLIGAFLSIIINSKFADIRTNNENYNIIRICIGVLFLNAFIFLWYWLNNALNPNLSNIQRYAILKHDVSVCRLAYSPLHCLYTLENADSLTWNMDIQLNVDDLKDQAKNCISINDPGLQQLCICNKERNCSLEICKNFKNNLGAFNDCIKEAAVIEKNPNICKEIIVIKNLSSLTTSNNEGDKQMFIEACATRVGRVLRDKTACGILSDISRKSYCENDVQYWIELNMNK